MEAANLKRNSLSFFAIGDISCIENWSIVALALAGMSTYLSLLVERYMDLFDP